MNIYNILDSEWSEERIDFTMMCVIYFYSIFSKRKVNLVGTFGGLKVKFPRSFQKRREEQNTN